MIRRLIYLLVALLICAPSLHSQVIVELKIKKRLYVIYEPIIATVTLTNRTGRDIPLADADGQRWFGFEVVKANGQPVMSSNTEYQLGPLTIPAGETVKKTVQLNTIYPICDFGLHRVRATVYFGPMAKFFVSPQVNIEITDGKTIWQQVVGVPDGVQGAGENRKFSLLSYRDVDRNLLYARVEDDQKGIVYCTFPLGKLITGDEPRMELDSMNRLHVLQLVGPKTYSYTEVGLNGERLAQKSYYATQTRPALRKDQAGEVAVVGGQVSAENAKVGPPSATDGTVPKLSDRPANIPKE